MNETMSGEPGQAQSSASRSFSSWQSKGSRLEKEKVRPLWMVSGGSKGSVFMRRCHSNMFHILQHYMSQPVTPETLETCCPHWRNWPQEDLKSGHEVGTSNTAHRKMVRCTVDGDKFRPAYKTTQNT